MKENVQWCPTTEAYGGDGPTQRSEEGTHGVTEGFELPPMLASRVPSSAKALVRHFDTGATRSAESDKNDYEGFLSPSALEAFGNYMTRHRVQPDGSTRASDNWQKGIPVTSYIKSLVRHTIDLWALQRGFVTKNIRKEFGDAAYIPQVRQDLACAVLFNAQGLLHEWTKQS